jgi:ribosome biogenesis GTPase
MSKRQINLQQSKRIHQKQTRIQQRAASDSSSTLSEGLVIKRYSRIALIEDRTGRRQRCAIRPDIQSLVAGDNVIWQPEGVDQGVVLSVSPRSSVLNRPDFRGVLKPVAANITQVLIVVAPVPEISWTLLDSYLVMTEGLGINTCIVLNKTDLDHDHIIRHQLTAIYHPLGYPVIEVSRDNLAQQDVLLKTLNNQTNVFVGQSGVGKSSIISRILPEENDINTGEISEHSNLGRHTTSNSCLYHLSGGGYLIDSPGIREFSLADMPIRNIAEGFREFQNLIHQCQFRNCNHQNAKGCAILKARDENIIHPMRYDSFIKLVLKHSKS